MLTSELLLHRYNGEELVPTRLPIDKKNRTLAEKIIDTFGLYVGKKRLEPTLRPSRRRRGLW